MNIGLNTSWTADFFQLSCGALQEFEPKMLGRGASNFFSLNILSLLHSCPSHSCIVLRPVLRLRGMVQGLRQEAADLVRLQRTVERPLRKLQARPALPMRHPPQPACGPPNPLRRPRNLAIPWQSGRETGSLKQLHGPPSDGILLPLWEKPGKPPRDAQMRRKAHQASSSSGSGTSSTTWGNSFSRNPGVSRCALRNKA